MGVYSESPSLKRKVKGLTPAPALTSQSVLQEDTGSETAATVIVRGVWVDMNMLAKTAGFLQ